MRFGIDRNSSILWYVFLFHFFSSHNVCAFVFLFAYQILCSTASNELVYRKIYQVLNQILKQVVLIAQSNWAIVLRH